MKYHTTGPTNNEGKKGDSFTSENWHVPVYVTRLVSTLGASLLIALLYGLTALRILRTFVERE
jgi:hypothetical protein